MPPVLMLLKGLPGSGKSTLADCLSTQLLWPVLDKDDSRDCLSQVRHLSRDELNSLSYDILLQCTQRQIANGISVIVDCPLAKLDLAEKFAALSTAHGAKLAIIGCEMADEKVWEARITARGQASAGTSQSHKPESWAALQALIHGYDYNVVLCTSWTTFQMCFSALSAIIAAFLQ